MAGRTSGMLVVLAAAALTLGAAEEAAAQGKGTCIKKAGEGTNTTVDGAKFQAWEAVLQATDWGSWASFMASGMKIGTAPGYKVSGVGSRCRPGGLGQICIMQATLCK